MGRKILIQVCDYYDIVLAAHHFLQIEKNQSLNQNCRILDEKIVS